MKPSNLNIGKRLGLGFGLVIILTFFVSMYTVSKLQRLANISEELYEHPYAVSNAVRDIRAYINAMHRSMKDVALSKNHEKIKKL